MLRGEEGNINVKNILFHLPTLVVCIFVLKIITVALVDTRYMIFNTPITLSRPSTHALQVLANTCHNTIKLFYQGQKGTY